MDTRQLCGWAYRDLDKATRWIDRFATEKFRAHGLPLGTDLVAVVRHARRAKRLFLLRDTMPALCLGALVAGVVGSVAAFVVEDFERLGTCLRAILYALLTGALLVYAWGWVLWRCAQAVHWARHVRPQGGPQDGQQPDVQLQRRRQQETMSTYNFNGPIDGGRHIFGDNGHYETSPAAAPTDPRAEATRLLELLRAEAPDQVETAELLTAELARAATDGEQSVNHSRVRAWPATIRDGAAASSGAVAAVASLQQLLGL